MPKHKPKIMTVDDEEFNLDILTDYLIEGGFEVVPAADGDVVLKLLEQHPDVDLIVLDRMMPRMNGMEVMKRLKESERWREIPVIMQTAAASSKQVEEGIQSGVYYYLAKPYDGKLLLAVVRAALRDHFSRMEMRGEVVRQKRSLGLMERGCFRFRTLEEAGNLAYFIANCFPHPDRVVYGLNELMVNAIEHGNLGIKYDEKAELITTGVWQQEVEKRLTMPENAGKFALLEYESTPASFLVTIRDQGKGFDWTRYMELSPERAMNPNGRGIAISRIKSFPVIEYKGCGNEVVCAVPKPAGCS